MTGHRDAIAVVQKTVPKALVTLERCIEETGTLENSAIETFSDQTGKIFEIIGPEAANFVKQKADVGVELKQLYEAQNKLSAELAHRQGKKFIFFSLYIGRY